ncbi:winged-helix domain-containing protein [Natrarchaeobius chitinivorans]|uniref:ArsR family transcriptional regulator n=1 Tax=Natrarchaeobius chitinivorans TaxID=1679083 RepID=A0A3N6M9C6_NATCH|nr:winged-helix domain-containing protein [Natrarchaeobius chitinivorans]RQG97234.1 ArsR family transcriptional regulator [Natrarchaeobius chitinivorans]
MTDSDDTILEFLRETGAAFSKRGIQVNFENRGVKVSYSTIKRRLEHLENADLIECVEEKGGYYEITDLGKQYLEGELDAEDLERD